MLPAFGQKQYEKGYHITLTIEGNQDSMMLMGNYFVGGTYAMDTAYRDKKGNFVFQSKDLPVMPGLYFFANQEGKFVEFLMYHEPMKKVKFKTKEEDWLSNMEVTGSVQNQQFYQYHRAMAKLYEDTNHVEVRVTDSVKNAFIRKYPDCMLSKMMVATRPVLVPTISETGDSMSNNERFDYYLHHYWDNIPLDDDMLVRTPAPIFIRPVKDFMDQVLKGAPPSVIMPLLDSTIEKSRKSPEVFKYLVHTFTEHYLQSNVMVYDEVYVHLVKRYYESGEAYWSSPSVIDEQVQRAHRWENILVGKIAPELIMKDTLGYAHSLYRMRNDYKLLVFWSPSCGHCKTIIPAVNEVYKKWKDTFDIGIYAVLSEPDDYSVVQWKKIINDKGLHEGWIHVNGGVANVDWREVYDVHTTPQIFLLDKDNRIIGKRMNAELFDMIMKSLVK